TILQIESHLSKNWVLRSSLRNLPTHNPRLQGWIKLNFDGASKGNPKKYCCGGVFYDHQGKFILGYYCNLGIQSNHVAEVDAVYW
ncbi:hypothetical protein KI387_035532, partial [Taxus chinensis]